MHMWNIERHTKPNGNRNKIADERHCALETLMSIVGPEMTWWALICAVVDPCVRLDC